MALDYAKNPGGDKTGPDGAIKVADVIKQIRLLQASEIKAEQAEIEQAEALKTLLAAKVEQAYADSGGLEYVSPRMRQLLLPKDKNYVAITPLPCGGLSQEINRRVQAHNDAAKDTGLISIKLATLGVGGSNPQNVGSLVREMQTAMVFSAPTEDRFLRLAFAIHHNGIAVQLPRKAMQSWQDWRIGAAAKNNGLIPTDMNSREKERTLVQGVAEGILHQGCKALQLLEQHQILIGEELLAEGVDPVSRGLIDPSQRDRGWPRAFGERVAAAIGSYKSGNNELFLP
ncbi:MAG: hypothetical protein ACRD82_04490, partial [Blastocatellia bacterium]